MSEELPLDEALQLEQRGYPLPGKSGVPVTRPTAAGLQWLAVPRACVGLAYRMHGGTTLEAIAFAPDPHVRLRSLELTAPVVHLTCSADGRLVAAACIDGSLQCINVTSTSLEVRWIIRNAHSHIVQDICAAVSSSRDFAASKSGPIHSLAFAPSGYALLLADAGNLTLSIYDAESLDPVNLVQNQTQVLCATWSTETPSNGVYPLAVGCVDGSIGVMTFSMSSGDIEKISTISALEDADKEGFVCTYLDWFDSGKSLASGYCRVTPSDNDDEEDEDDSAQHEATLYVGPMENYQDRTEVGDVVSFFSVPRKGRHAFFSSFCPSSHTPLLFVASNVASEVGVVAPESGEWQVIDLQEGCGASTPTDEDDEFTFPMGIATVQLPDTSFTSEALLLASTDGSLSVFDITNQNNPEAFCIPQSSIVHGIACLPAEPLEMVEKSLPTPPLSPEPEEIESSEESDAHQEAMPAFGSGSASGLSFGSGAPSSFGSPAFGKTSALGVGTMPSTPFSFGKPGANAPSAFGSAAFGQPSTLGIGRSSAIVSPAACFGTPTIPLPFGGGGSAPIFGSARSSGGGFAALAASPAAGSGFGASLGPSPFDAFSKSSKSNTGSVPPSMAMPLFGDSTSIQASPIKDPVEESTLTPLAEIPPIIEQPPPELAEEPATFDESGIKKAALVFDSFDENKTGTVLLEKFEAMLDELGEGLHGDELEAQRALIDPEGTSQIGRSAFVSWYVKLLAGDDGSGDHNLLDSEQEEERAKAEEVFASLATTAVAGKPAIAKGDFNKLMEAMGTTYCEEEHRKTIKKLTKSDGMIYGDDFTEWYLDWLFGESNSDEEKSVNSNESRDVADDGEDAGAGGEEALNATGGWGNIFATSEDTWKCDSCMVRNDANATICVACETPKPGHVAPIAPSSEPSVPSGASIGPGGFSFGGAAPVAPASAQPSAISELASTGARGFTFGGASAPAAPVSKPSKTTGMASIGAGELSLAGGAPALTAPASEPWASSGLAPIVADGLKFAGYVVPEGVKPFFGDSKAQSFAAKETLEKVALASATKRALDEAQPEFAGRPATLDEPGAKKAALVFDSIDEKKTGTLPLERFEDILDELGEGFHGEELEAQRALIDPECTNQIGRSAFVSWYVKLLAGDDGSGADGNGTSLDSEQEEERAKAEEVFASLATTAEAGKPAIAKGDFNKLMEAMGTTYCEEEHRKTIKRLTKSDGMIYGDDFTEWYLDWLFGESDSDEEKSVDSDESRDDAEAGEDAGAGGEEASNATGGWGNIFATSEDTWKCDSCMVRNDANATICVACETSKPGHVAPIAPSSEPSVPSEASIGPGGFSFGGAAPVAPASTQPSAISGLSSIGAGGFKFGGAAPAQASVPASIGAGGFTFGGGTAPVGGFTFGSSAFGKSDTTAASRSTTADSCFSLDAAKVQVKTKEDITQSEAKAFESSRYPPLSTKAPTFFGAAKTSSPAPSKPAGSSYPPMSSKAPVPFGSRKVSAIGTTKHSGSSAYPPISLKAPTPFEAAKTSAPAPSKPAGSSYPPMSAKAPVLFGSGKASAIVMTKHSGSSAYLPISSKTPTPFEVAKTSAPAPSKPVGSSYPPLFANAPVPFGGEKAGAVGSTKPSASSVYPPISSKAPTPFVAAAKASILAPSKPVPASYPPVASKAPTPFVASSPEPGRPTTTSVPSETRAAPSSSLPFLTPAASDYESQFRKLIVQFQASISMLADNRVLADSLGSFAGVGSDFEGEIEKLVEQTELVRSACSGLHKHVTNQKDQSIFLLSRNTDIKRQTEDARRLIDAHAVSIAKQSHIVQTQPLDAESERFRRRVAVKALMVTRDLETIENRISMLRGICDVQSDDVTGESIALSSQDRKNVLFEALISNFNRTQLFKEEAAERARTVRSYAATIPSIVLPGAPSTQLSRARSLHASFNGRSSKHRLIPAPLRVSDSQLKSRSSSRQSSSEGRGKWAKIEIAMLNTKVKAVPPKKLTRLARIGSSSAKSVSLKQGRRTAALKPSLFLSPSGTESAHRSIRDDISRREPLIFSSPVSMPRSQWLVSSDTDQARVKAMSMNFPNRLKEVSATEAAREALAGFGTTPEKTERAIELRNSARMTELSGSPTPPKALFEKTPRGLISSAAFPPMSAKAPTAFSMNTADKVRDARDLPLYPPIAKQAKPFSIAPSAPASTNAEKVRRTSTDAVSLQPKSSFALKDDRKSSEKAAESALGNLKGLGDSLFAEGSKTSVRSEKSDFGLSGVNLGLREAIGEKSDPDYHAILTEFYKTHDPAKLIEVVKTLEKYKGREVEMFSKLAKKYKVSSPLDSFGSIAKPSVSPSVGAAQTHSSSISSAYGSTAEQDLNVTPSVDASRPQASLSSFGGTMSLLSPLGQPLFGEPSASTFGPSAPPASPSPFSRSSTQTTSSFGVAKQTVPLSSSSPFGTPATQSASALGVAPLAAPPSSTFPLIGGLQPREVLVAFYQKHNPSRLNEVDNLLIKYKNSEELLFRKLAKKYKMDPSQFGISSNPQPSGFGSGTTPGGFGQTTPFGGSAAYGFGSSLGSGQPAAAFGSPSGASTFGSPSATGGHAFGSLTAIGRGGQPATFSSLAMPGASPSPFGGGTQTGGFGSMSGSGGFGGGFSGGGTTPFGAPRR